MTANELRIGNLLTINNPIYHPSIKGTPLMLTSICPVRHVTKSIYTHSIGLEHINQVPNRYYESYAQFLEFVEPITLTEEIILKSGFIEVYRSKIHVTYDKDGHGEIGVSFQFLTNSISLRHYGKDIRIQFVHQLQNLYFALTGEELTIKP